MKTIQKVPPSDRTQEFKDGVLWADCVRLLDQDDVLLATQDKAFYTEREYGKGLAANLSWEVKSKTKRFQITHSTAEVLARIRTEVLVDDTWFVAVVKERAHPTMTELLSRSGFEVEGGASVERQLFATENPDVLYFKYTIKLRCVDVTDRGRTQSVLLLDGDGSLKPDTPDVREVRPGQEQVVFTNPDGTRGQVTNIFAAANIMIGHRTVAYTVRHPLDHDGAG